MTPFLRTKNSSAPLGAKSDGERRAARSLLSCALWSGMGRLWRGMGGRRPQRRQHGLLGFHQPRDTQHAFPLPSGDSKESNLEPGQRVFTNHETRITAFMPAVKSRLPGSLLPAIARYFPAFPGFLAVRSQFACPRRPTIARHLPTVAHDGSLLLMKNIARSKSPSTVSDSRSAARRAPFAAIPVALRARSFAADTQGLMLRKENVLDCTNSGTFYLALAFARLESPLRSGHHRERRRSVTARGLTRSTTGRGLRRRDMPSGQETIS